MWLEETLIEGGTPIPSTGSRCDCVVTSLLQWARARAQGPAETFPRGDYREAGQGSPLLKVAGGNSGQTGGTFLAILSVRDKAP